MYPHPLFLMYTYMNAVKEIAGVFLRGLENLVLMIGKFGAFKPIDDSKSGVKIGDKVYQVVVSLNGCYWYLDDNGKKHPVAEIPNKEFEWTNIAEKVIKDFRTCYRTLGGKVEVWSWYLLNDQMDPLKEQHRITDSLDVDYPVGTLLTKIPEDWVMIDCDFPDMTERDITFIKRCYKTPNGKVEIEGLESIDDKNNVRESIYRVLQSTDVNFPAGYEFRFVPADWVRMVCDFPDMTERDVTYILECFTTPKGKVQIEGLEAIDNILDVRESTYSVIQSTDEDIVVGSKYETIPEEWIRMVCDFPDMTGRDIIDVNECYSTGNGKVEIKGYQAVDAVLGVREQYYFIVNTTDANYPQWTKIERIPNEWQNTVCDFADMTDRHAVKVDECYLTDGGKIHLTGYRALDSVLGVRAEYLIVSETTDESVERNTIYTSVPEGWERVVCDFPDATTADTEVVANCYKTEGGKVQLRTYMTLDGNGKLRESRHVVMRTTDNQYKIGAEIEEIPNIWVLTECDFASATQRHVVPIVGCYNTGAGKISVEGYSVIDNSLDKDEFYIRVVESTDADVPVGSEFDSIDESWSRAVCDFASTSQRHIVPIVGCYDTGAGKIRVEGYSVLNNTLGEDVFYLRVAESTDKNIPVGSAFDSISESWTRTVCDFADLSTSDVKEGSVCYDSGAGTVGVRYVIVYDGLGGIRKAQYIVYNSSDENYAIGDVLTVIPEDWVVVECDFYSKTQRHILPLKECYHSDEGDIYIEGERMFDNTMKEVGFRAWVVESTAEAYPAGTALDQIPSGMTKVPCLCKTC